MLDSRCLLLDRTFYAAVRLNLALLRHDGSNEHYYNNRSTTSFYSYYSTLLVPVERARANYNYYTQSVLVVE
jgi:hypothetical protein